MEVLSNGIRFVILAQNQFMAHWHPGRVVLLKESSDSRIKRFFRGCEVVWVIAFHNNFVYLKLNRYEHGDLIVRCHQDDMSLYFTEKMFHDPMPYVNGPFKDIKIFPDDFFLITKHKQSKDPPIPGAPF